MAKGVCLLCGRPRDVEGKTRCKQCREHAGIVAKRQTVRRRVARALAKCDEAREYLPTPTEIQAGCLEILMKRIDDGGIAVTE